MKIKCNSCGKVLNRQKQYCVQSAARHGFKNLQEYLDKYICRECTIVKKKENYEAIINNEVKKQKSNKEKKPKAKSLNDLPTLPDIKDTNEIKKVEKNIEPEINLNEIKDDVPKINLDKIIDDDEEEINLNDIPEEFFEGEASKESILTKEDEKELEDFLKQEDDEEEIS